MVQMVFQNPFDTFLPTETIEQIMMRPLEVNGIGATEQERRERILHLLEDGGLSPAEDFLRRYPHELSGGQLQRISILRSMSVNRSFWSWTSLSPCWTSLCAPISSTCCWN